MELRDKETGEVKFVEYIELRGVCPVNFGNYKFNSIAELNEKFEDYKPAEPLIKDEKIRKAVRAWAEANGASRAYIVDLGILRDESSGNEIKFNGEPFVGWVTSLKTIIELCGEEEE
jgi:hypothetical protein